MRFGLTLATILILATGAGKVLRLGFQEPIWFAQHLEWLCLLLT